MTLSRGIKCDFRFSVKHKQVLYEERQTVACQGKVYLFCSSTERGEKRKKERRVTEGECH